MDTFARALLIADKLIADKALSQPIADRYAGYRSGMGKKIMTGKTSLPALEKWAIAQGEPPLISGRQEQLENVLNQYLFGGKV